MSIMNFPRYYQGPLPKEQLRGRGQSRQQHTTRARDCLRDSGEGERVVRGEKRKKRKETRTDSGSMQIEDAGTEAGEASSKHNKEAAVDAAHRVT